MGDSNDFDGLGLHSINMRKTGMPAQRESSTPSGCGRRSGRLIEVRICQGKMARQRISIWQLALEAISDVLCFREIVADGKAQKFRDSSGLIFDRRWQQF